MAIESVLHQLWQFKTQDEIRKSSCVFIVFYCRASYLAYAGLNVKLIIKPMHRLNL